MPAAPREVLTPEQRLDAHRRIFKYVADAYGAGRLLCHMRNEFSDQEIEVVWTDYADQYAIKAGPSNVAKIWIAPHLLTGKKKIRVELQGSPYSWETEYPYPGELL